MTSEEVKIKLKELIEEVLPDVEDCDFSKKIVPEYGVESVGIIRLIVAVESAFDVKYTDYELDLDAYDTFDDLAVSLQKKLDAEED